MAARKVLVLVSGEIQQLQSGDTVDGLVIGTDVQAWDADLDALAALDGTAGMLSRTGAGTFAVRTLTAPAAGITISNPTGAAGNPTLALADDLAGLEGLGTTGVAVRTAASTWTTRTITGTAGRITLLNGDGVAGAPTIDLASGVATPGTYGSVTVDTYGRVTAGTVDTGAMSTVSSMTNNTGGTLVIGTPVYGSAAGEIAKGDADADGTSDIIGLLYDDIANTASGNVVTNGEIVATTTEWDAVAGTTGGLAVNVTYYLAGGAAGAITSTAPASGFVKRVGIGLSTTRMLIDLGPRIQL